MPLLPANGTHLHVDVTGPDDAPAILFSNSIGATIELWDDQVRALAPRYRCIRYDTRGHGRSPTAPGPVTLGTLADDAAGILDALGLTRAHFVGISLGGMTGQAFAARHPTRLHGLVLMATANLVQPASAWHDRAATVRQGGMAAIADMALGRWFTPAFAASPPARAVRERFLAIDPEGYALCCEAIATMDLREADAAIAAPTLVVAGAADVSTPPEKSQDICARIEGAELVVLPAAPHIFNVELPGPTNRHLAAFLDALSPTPTTPRPAGATFEAGLANRKSVLGADHVARSLAAAGSFAGPWQDFITRTAWGEIWGDPTLPWKTRSLLTLALMVALGREEEFKLHLHPALRNGVTPEELRALLIQCAVYAGVPAANAAFRWARDGLGDRLDT